MRITEHDLDQLYYDAYLTDLRLPNALRKQKLTFWMDMRENGKNSRFGAETRILGNPGY